MISDYCQHQTELRTCLICSAHDSKPIGLNDYSISNTQTRYGQDLCDGYQYPTRNPVASSVDVSRLQDEVRRLGLLVTKLITIFAPGEKIP